MQKSTGATRLLLACFVFLIFVLVTAQCYGENERSGAGLVNTERAANGNANIELTPFKNETPGIHGAFLVIGLILVTIVVWSVYRFFIKITLNPDKVRYFEQPPSEDYKIEESDIPTNCNLDPDGPYVYIVSDFHLGRDGTAQAPRDMVDETLLHFIWWLKAVEADANGKKYDVVMNGDFIDIWKSQRFPKGHDTYKERLKGVLETNKEFLHVMGRCMNACANGRFHYIIGNHDDIFDQGNDAPSVQKADPKFKGFLGTEFYNMLLKYMGVDRGKFPKKISFYDNVLKLHVEHGHKYDKANYRDFSTLPPPGPSKGQTFTELLTEYAAANKELFGQFMSPPENDFIRYLQCRKLTGNIDGADQQMLNNLRKQLTDMQIDNWFAKKITEICVSDSKLLEEALKKTDTDKKIPDELAQAEKIRANKANSPTKITVFGHTHCELLDPEGKSDLPSIHANTGSWLGLIKYQKVQNTCELLKIKSPLPFVRIRKASHVNGGKDIAIVELKYFDKKAASPSFNEMASTVDLT